MTKRCKLIYRQARSPLRPYRQANFRLNPPRSRDQIKIHSKLKLPHQIKISVVSCASTSPYYLYTSINGCYPKI